MQIKLVCMEYPCNSCIIVQGLIKEVIQKVLKIRDIQYEEVTLHHPKEIYNVKNMEVEKLPALFVDDEQITAGNLISTKQLLNIIDNN